MRVGQNEIICREEGIIPHSCRCHRNAVRRVEWCRRSPKVDFILEPRPSEAPPWDKE